MIMDVTRYDLARRFSEIMHLIGKPDIDGADQALQQVEADYGVDAYEYMCDLIAQRKGIPPKEAPRP